MRDKILAFVKQNGPCLPVEVKAGNSFLAKAYLEELVDKGLLKKSSEKIGESFIYFAAGQEELVNEKMSSLSSEKTAKIYAQKKIEVTPEIAKKREEFDSRLKEIEAKEKSLAQSTEHRTAKIFKKQDEFDALIKRTEEINNENRTRSVFELKNRIEMRDSEPTQFFNKKVIVKTGEKIEESARKPEPRIEPKENIQVMPYSERRVIEVIPKKPFFEAAKEAVRNVVSKPKQKIAGPSERDDFVEKSISFLISNKIEILQKEETAKSADLVVNVPSAVGMVKFFVKIKSRKKISKSELVAIYAEALEQRMPAILLTNGELAETSKNYLKSVGGFLRVKVF